MSQAAGARYVDPRTGLEFPSAIGDLEFVEVEHYEDAALGSSVRYAGPSGDKADIYVYDHGRPFVPDGPQSPRLQQEFANALEAIRHYSRSGMYRDLKLKTENVDSSTVGAMFLSAVYSYSQAPGEKTLYEGRRTSWLLMRGHHGQFVKVRYTCLDENGDVARARLRELISWLSSSMNLERH